MSLGRLPLDAKALARMRRHVAGFVSLAAVCAFVACTGQRPNAPALAPVIALPSPSPPPWIAFGLADREGRDAGADPRDLRQAGNRGRGALGTGTARRADHVSIEPQLGGHFAVLTPRMIGFVPDRALPIGTRVRGDVVGGAARFERRRCSVTIWRGRLRRRPSSCAACRSCRPPTRSTPAPVGSAPDAAGDGQRRRRRRHAVATTRRWKAAATA